MALPPGYEEALQERAAKHAAHKQNLLPLLARCRAVLVMCQKDKAEGLEQPERQAVLARLLTDIAEVL